MSINIEAMTMLNMARRQILPACIRYSSVLGNAVGLVSSAGVEAGPQKEMLENVCSLIAEMKNHISKLESIVSEGRKVVNITEKARFSRDNIVPAMQALRATSDELEAVVDAELWPLPTYAEMLFIR